jgi:4-amino-4-deoxy-L-arabinose transferase-like glycosyltransferase
MTTAVASDPTQATRRSRPNRWFWVATTGFALIGLGIRIGAVVGRPNRFLGGDAYYFHNAANLLAEGHGFIDPFYWYGHNLHWSIQTASWPPLFVWTLAAAAVVGFKTYFAQRIWAGIIGSIAVVVCGMAGREIAGRRVGAIVALIVAIYPNIWMTDEPALSETITPLLIGLVLWSAYRFWKRPSVKRVAVLSLCLSLAALGRDELTSLFILLLLPMCLLARNTAWRQRFMLVGAGVLVAIVVIGPWVGYNMSRFSKPVYISDGLGVTLASADCGPTWTGGRIEGFWDIKCALAVKLPKVHPGTDESIGAGDEETAAVTFIKHHLDRLVPVTLAKLGRGFGFFKPVENVSLDIFFEDRPYHWAYVGLWSYYALLALSIPGFVVLVRRRVTPLPLIAVTLAVMATMIIAFGGTRYRTPFEVVIAILAAVAIDGLWNAIRHRPPEQVRPPEPEPAPAPMPRPEPEPVGAPSA